MASLRLRLFHALIAAHGWRAACAWAVALVLALRLGLGLTMGTAWVIVKPYLPASRLADTTPYDSLPVYSTFPADAVLGVWQRWDAVHYLNLARRGYGGLSEGETAFYPLYPFLVGALARSLGVGYLLSGLIVSTAAAAAALTCLYRLVELRYGAASARWTVLALTTYPTSFFLVAPFTEALFLALTLGAFLAAYARRWWLAGVFGALSSLTHGPGVLTSAALAWIGGTQWKEENPLLRPGLAVRWVAPLSIGIVSPILGGLAFSYWRRVAGYAPMPEVWRTYSGFELTDPLRGTYDAIAQMIAVHDLPTILEVTTAFLFLGLTLALFANRRWRQPEWAIYIGANLVLFLSKHSLVASSFQSMGRYVLVLFPGFIVIGDWLAHQRPRWRFIYVVISSMLLIGLSVLFAFWVFSG